MAATQKAVVFSGDATWGDLSGYADVMGPYKSSAGNFYVFHLAFKSAEGGRVIASKASSVSGTWSIATGSAVIGSTTDRFDSADSAQEGDTIYIIAGGRENIYEGVDVIEYDMSTDSFGSWENIETSGKFSLVAGARIAVSQGSTKYLVAVFNGLVYSDMGTLYDKIWYNKRTLVGSWGTNANLDSGDTTEEKRLPTLSHEPSNDYVFGAFQADNGTLLIRHFAAIDASSSSVTILETASSGSQVWVSSMTQFTNGSNIEIRTLYPYTSGSDYWATDNRYWNGSSFGARSNHSTAFSVTGHDSGTYPPRRTKLIADFVHEDKIHGIVSNDWNSAAGGDYGTNTDPPTTYTWYTEESAIDSSSMWENLHGLKIVARDGGYFVDGLVQIGTTIEYWEFAEIVVGGSLAPPSPLRYVAGHANLRR